MSIFQRDKKDEGAPQAKGDFLDEMSPMVGFLPGVGPMLLAAKAIDHYAAHGHMFDETKAPTPTTTTTAPSTPAALDPADAAKRIDSGYIPAKEVESKVTVDPDHKLGKLDSKEARLAAMSSISQWNQDDNNSEHYCGPAAIIAGAIYAKGGDGVDALIQQMKSDGKNDKDFAERKDLLDMIDRKAKAGNLDSADMQLLQTQLYTSMRKKMQADPLVPDANKKEEGLDQKTMSDYVSKNPALSGMFKENGLSLSFVDSGGPKRELDHFVLDIHDGNHQAIYDAQPRKDGKQVVTNADDVAAYRQTKHLDLGPTAG